MNPKKINDAISFYFKTSEQIAKAHLDNILTFQFFQRKNNVIFCGSAEVTKVLNLCILGKYELHAVPEGSKINAMDIALTLKGKASDIIKFEGIIDGILSRSSSIATNAYHASKSTKKPIVMMFDRHDHFENQQLDGYSAYIGGIKIFCSNAQSSLLNIKEQESFGSIPHSLIQNFHGNIEATLIAYKNTFPDDKIIALVDFHNDVIKDSLIAYKVLKKQLYGVRVDTPISNIDKCLQSLPLDKSLYGANSKLIFKLRKELDSAGANNVKIIVSSGLTPSKIKLLEKNKTPIDFYGIGNYLSKLNIKFTGDAVLVNGNPISKHGREFRKNEKLNLLVS